MAILFSNEIYAAICDELSSAEESVQILTAYGKTKAVAAIIESQTIYRKQENNATFQAG